MANRERKRSERQKRKARVAQRQTEIGERTEAKNSAAREQLEPLTEGERPLIVTLAAVLSALVCVLSVVGWALWDTLRDEPQPSLGRVVPFTLIVAVMAYGLWQTRYWAVMGFQAALALIAIISGLGLVGSVTVPLAIGNLALLVAAGALFYFMIRAMARIQMPYRAPRE
ncbi:MAG: hypothetical protein H0W09_02395 [Solirubrobacterales bacterium]|nr:hypothetical protein [Solirubrobacterales bacterium]